MIVEELAAKLGLEIDAESFAKGEEILHQLHHSFALAGAALVGALAVGAAALAKSTADAAFEAGKLAQSTGIDLEVIQKLGFAAEATGVSTDTLAVGLRHLAKTGVSDVKEGVLEIAERFHNMKDGGDKVRIAMEKFGRSGAQLIPLLNKGKEGISELMEEAEELGLVFSEEDVEASRDFKQSLHVLESTFVGIGRTIGKFVMPYATKFFKAFAAFVGDIKHMVPWVQKTVAILKVLGVVLLGIGAAVLAVNLAVGFMEGEFLAAAAAAVASAVAAAAAWLIAAAPVIALAAIFTVLFLIIQDLYVFFQGGDSLFGRMIKQHMGLAKAVSDVYAGYKALQPYFSAFVDLLAAGIKPLEVMVDLTSLFLANLLKLASLGAINIGMTNTSGFFGGKSPQADAMALQSQAMAGMFGSGAASPAAAASASAGGVGGGAPLNIGKIEVHASPGMSAKEVAGHVVQAIDEHHKATIRSAGAAVAQ